jgi:signal transduction histidine kinase
MRSREWLTMGVTAVAVVILGGVELTQTGLMQFAPVGLVVAAVGFLVCLGLAVGAAPWAPGIALTAAWAAGLTQLIAGVPVLLTEATLIVVVFAAARWGSPPTVVLGAFSVGAIPVLAVAWVKLVGVNAGFGGRLLFDLLGAAGATATVWRLLLLGFTVLGLPFVSGVALRFRDRASSAQSARQTAETEARQAQEIARLQEAQNRLARDVHDVVGHSLTVILAQAQSAEFIDDTDKLKQTMQTIVDSARTSLRDVRQVLTPGPESTAGRPGGLDALIEAVRASGTALVSTEAGDARPLPPELEAVAYRVLQEMLTNAIKHGRRDRPVLVERHWPEKDSTLNALRILVRNDVSVSAVEPGGGQGLAGMRRRLESVGGRFHVHRIEEAEGEAFEAVALIPVRSLASGLPT